MSVCMFVCIIMYIDLVRQCFSTSCLENMQYISMHPPWISVLDISSLYTQYWHILSHPSPHISLHVHSHVHSQIASPISAYLCAVNFLHETSRCVLSIFPWTHKTVSHQYSPKIPFTVSFRYSSGTFFAESCQYYTGYLHPCLIDIPPENIYSLRNLWVCLGYIPQNISDCIWIFTRIP